MQQSPSREANMFSAIQEIARILWNPKVHYRIHKCPPPVSILNQNDQAHPSHPTSWRSISILFSHLSLGLPCGLFPSDSPTKILYIYIYIYNHYFIWQLLRANSCLFVCAISIIHSPNSPNTRRKCFRKWQMVVTLCSIYLEVSLTKYWDGLLFAWCSECNTSMFVCLLPVLISCDKTLVTATVWRSFTRSRRSNPFWTEYGANHYGTDYPTKP